MCINIYIAIKSLWKARGNKDSGADFLPFRVPHDNTPTNLSPIWNTPSSLKIS